MTVCQIFCMPVLQIQFLGNLWKSLWNIHPKEISDQHKQGQHTTTFAEMFDLTFNAKIIDTPGIKGFGIVDMDKEEIGDYFPEFFEIKHNCSSQYEG